MVMRSLNHTLTDISTTPSITARGSRATAAGPTCGLQLSPDRIAPLRPPGEAVAEPTYAACPGDGCRLVIARPVCRQLPLRPLCIRL